MQSTYCSRQPWLCCWSDQPLLSAEANGQVLKVTVKNILIAEFQYGFLYYLFVSYSGYVTLALMVLHTLLCILDCSEKANFNYFHFLHAYYFDFSMCTCRWNAAYQLKGDGYFKLIVFLRKAIEQRNLIAALVFQIFQSKVVVGSGILGNVLYLKYTCRRK